MSDPSILVTGGNRGIGRAIVRTLVGHGANVAFTFGSDAASAEALVEELGERVQAHRLDLSDPDDPMRVVAAIEDARGPLDGLVNNAGTSAQGLLAMASDADWQRVIDVNLGGVFRCCRAVLPSMLRRRRGSIVNVASLGAIRGVAGQTLYAASKAGVLGLTRSLAREVGRRNVRVNAVAPGFVATDMTAELSEAQVGALRAAECLPGGVDVESVAETVGFLLSDRASSITGQCWVVDAGVSA